MAKVSAMKLPDAGCFHSGLLWLWRQSGDFSVLFLAAKRWCRSDSGIGIASRSGGGKCRYLRDYPCDLL